MKNFDDAKRGMAEIQAFIEDSTRQKLPIDCMASAATDLHQFTVRCLRFQGYMLALRIPLTAIDAIGAIMSIARTPDVASPIASVSKFN